MEPTKSRTAAPAIVLCLCKGAVGDEALCVNRIATAALNARQEHTALQHELYISTAALIREAKALAESIPALIAEHGLSEDNIAELTRKLVERQGREAYLVGRLNYTRRALEISKRPPGRPVIHNPQKLEKELGALREWPEAEARKYDKLMKDLGSSVKEEKEQFEQAVPLFFKKPAGRFSMVASPEVTVSFYNSQADGHWNTVRGEHIGFCMLEFAPKRLWDPGPHELIAGKYPILKWNEKSLYFMAGQVFVRVTMDRESWRDRRTMIAFAEAMIDLEGLARIDSDADRPIDRLVEMTIQTHNETWRIGTEWRAVEAAYNGKREGLETLISCAGWSRPWHPAFVQSLNRQAQTIEQDIVQLQKRVKIDQVLLQLAESGDPKRYPSQAAQWRRRLTQIDQKLQDRRRPIFAKLQRLARSVKSDSGDFDRMMRGFFKTPTGRYDRIMPPKIQTYLVAGYVQAEWRDHDGATVATLGIAIGPKDAPASYIDIEPNGRYPSHNPNEPAIYLRAGQFHLSLKVKQEQWQNEWDMADFLNSLIDLDGLKSIDTDKE